MVVLPAPLGPRKPTTVPASTSKLRWSTAVSSPKRLVRSWTSIAAIGGPFCSRGCGGVLPGDMVGVRFARVVSAEAKSQSA